MKFFMASYVAFADKLYFGNIFQKSSQGEFSVREVKKLIKQDLSTDNVTIISFHEISETECTACTNEISTTALGGIHDKGK